MNYQKNDILILSEYLESNYVHPIYNWFFEINDKMNVKKIAHLDLDATGLKNGIVQVDFNTSRWDPNRSTELTTSLADERNEQTWKELAMEGAFLMKQIESTLPYFEFRIEDANDNNKTIKSNGEFTRNGESLGEDGTWLNKTRFAIHIPQWKGWWVGIIVYDKDKVKVLTSGIVEKNVNNPPNDVNTVELNNFESGYLYSNTYF